MKANSQFITRINEAEKAALFQMAEAKGMSASEYVKKLIRKELNKNKMKQNATA